MELSIEGVICLLHDQKLSVQFDPLDVIFNASVVSNAKLIKIEQCLISY